MTTRAPINSVAALPTGKPSNGLERSLGQVIAKGRDTPAGLYPLTTRNDVEHQVGYVGPDTALWAITGGLTEQQNTGITDSRNLNAPSTAENFVSGDIPIVPQSGLPTRIGKYDWAVENRSGGLVQNRPKNVPGPYLESDVSPETRKEAVDLNIRGNMAYNEWENPLKEVFAQGKGFALSGPAYASSSVNVDAF